MTCLWKSCLSALNGFSEKLATNKLSSLVSFFFFFSRHFNEKHSHLSQMTEGRKDIKGTSLRAECDLSSKAKIYPRKFRLNEKLELKMQPV